MSFFSWFSFPLLSLCCSVQIPRWTGCYKRSDRNRIYLHKFSGQRDHVSCLYNVAFHRGRCPAGILSRIGKGTEFVFRYCQFEANKNSQRRTGWAAKAPWERSNYLNCLFFPEWAGSMNSLLSVCRMDTLKPH